MKKSNYLKMSLLALMPFLFLGTAFPCSMYKITSNGITMVGNNEDSWGRDSRIWFEQGINGNYGAAYVGYLRKRHPDGGINEYGLAFDAFTMPHRKDMPERDPNKENFVYSHMKTILQQCKNVDEVYAFLEKLNLHGLNGSFIFNGGMLLFVDKTGKYLVVEAHKMTFGNDEKFVLANFSHADTKDLSEVKIARYCKGVEFLNNKNLETNLPFCTALSDTMSVNRAKAGDGTLYTSIYNLNEGVIHTYFFHDFTLCKSFNLKEELAKGDHSYTFSELFPESKAYQKFLNYKTPQNNKYIFFFLISCGLLFFASSIFYFMYFLKSPNKNYKYLKAGISVLSAALAVYMFVLLRNQGIFYFPSPYNDSHSFFLAVVSYLPYVLALSIVPLSIISAKIIRQKMWNGFANYLLFPNLFFYLILIGFLAYWKLFGIFS